MKPVPKLAPDLAVEVLSESNTREEMARKLKDDFHSGVRLVWYVDPKQHSAEIFTAVDQVAKVDADGSLDGGDVLPGFRLSLHKLFAKADRQGPK